MEKQSRFINANTLEAFVRKPIRPLGKISDFVVEVLPDHLAAIQEGRMEIGGLSLLVEQQLQGVDADLVGDVLTGRDREIALLDLLIMQSALGNSKGEVPHVLTHMIEHFAKKEGRIPALTYEDVILINPLDTDPRTFTRGRVGQAELAFYQTHAVIEEQGGAINKIVKQALVDLQQGDMQQAVHVLSGIAESSQIIVAEMLGMKALNPKDFAAFRDYFGGYPEGNKGPSGAFSPAIAVLDVLLSGNDLTEDRHAYLGDNRQYFPREGQREIDEAYALVSHTGALDSYRGQDQTIDQEIGALHHFLTKFRGNHEVRVREQIPQALEGKISGTGGETDVATFLRERTQFNKLRRSI